MLSAHHLPHALRSSPNLPRPQWCEDHLASLPGSQGVHPYYDDFSTPCYDGGWRALVCRGVLLLALGQQCSVKCLAAAALLHPVASPTACATSLLPTRLVGEYTVIMSGSFLLTSPPCKPLFDVINSSTNLCRRAQRDHGWIFCVHRRRGLRVCALPLPVGGVESRGERKEGHPAVRGISCSAARLRGSACSMQLLMLLSARCPSHAPCNWLPLLCTAGLTSSSTPASAWSAAPARCRRAARTRRRPTWAPGTPPPRRAAR